MTTGSGGSRSGRDAPWRPFEVALVEMLAAGVRHEEVAFQLSRPERSVSVRTVRRWAADPEVRRLVVAQRATIEDQVRGRLLSLVEDAIDALARAVRDRDLTTSRQAATVILAQYLRYAEHGELAHRVDELESALLSLEQPARKGLEG